MSAKEIMEWFKSILTVCVPILVALVGIIPTVISNRKKTQESIDASNKEREKQDAKMTERMEKMQTTLDNHIREDEDERARNKRYRILRFYDEMCENRDHSESHFEDILDDIDEYEKYCETHPEFKNNRGRVAMEHIKESYAKIKSRGGFLTHDIEQPDTARENVHENQ